MIDITRYLSHRKPFLLLDHVTEIEKDRYVKGTTYVSESDWYFQGHFPGFPILPGVIMVEIMAQAGCVLVGYSRDLDASNYNTYLANIERVQFQKIIHPNQEITWYVEIARQRDQFWRFKGSLLLQEETACKGEFLAILEQKT